MDKKYSKEFEVRYYEVNKHQEATPISLLNYLEETAISHSESVGLGIDRLKSDCVSWVLNRWQLHIMRYPLYGEKILVKTWPSGFERFYATREFVIENGRGERIAQATSLWLLINIDKRRPTRIPPEFGDAYGIHPERALNKEFGPLSSIQDYQYSRDYRVRRSDIDTNHHVNNTRYAEWLMEVVPEEVYENFVLSFLEIEYRKETAYGCEILSNCSQQFSSSNSIEYFHCISDKNNHSELALAATRWTKR